MFRMRYGSKFKNVRQEEGGILYHSKKEANYAHQLQLRKLAGDIKDWTRQVKIPLDIGRFHIANYFIDFVVEHNDGMKEYVEVKGFETDVWKMKWKIFEALYSEDKMNKLTIIK